MERGLFESTFRAAAAQALEFARTFIEEPLPDALRFRVQLNARDEEGNSSALQKATADVRFVIVNP